jgi:hypothetical protein
MRELLESKSWPWACIEAVVSKAEESKGGEFEEV